MKTPILWIAGVLALASSCTRPYLINPQEAIKLSTPSDFVYDIDPIVFTRGIYSSGATPVITLDPGMTWTVASGTLPTGLTLNSTTGVISGTPTVISASASYTINVLLNGVTESATINITVNDQPPANLTYTDPLILTINQAMTPSSPSSTGGAVVSYSVSPALPAGLALSSSTGVISGTPTAISALTAYVITATNTGGSTTFTQNIQVNDIPPAFTYTTNPLNAQRTVAITPDVPINTGGTPTSYSVSPSLPTGLSLDTGTGIVSGTPTAITATANYTVTATNSGGSANRILTITVFDAPPAFNYTTNPVTYTRGTAITANNVISTGGAISSFSVSPSLPAGLSLNVVTGQITGTPTAVSPTATYTVTGTNSGGTGSVGLVITVNDQAPAFTYTSTPVTYTVGVAISANNPINTGGTVISYSVSPLLPSGLSLNTSTGVISGTPTAVAPTANYTVTATNSGGSATATVNITVNDQPPVFSYTTNPAVYVKDSAITNNSPINTGGSVVSYSVSPALPAGLSLNTSTGVISGTPTTVTAAANYTVTATNTGGSANVAVNITINDIPGSFYYPTNPGIYTINSAIPNNDPVNTGGTPISYSVSPSLPTGLSLNTSTGRISGTPTAITASASYTVTLNTAGGSTTTNVTIAVNDVTPAFSYLVNPATYTKGSAITANTVNSTGGTIVSFSVTPPLPTGLSLNPSNGTITGTPTAVSPTATYTVTGTNSGGSATVGLSITVNDAAPAFSYAVNPATYTLGTAIAANTVTSTGGAILSFSVSPALPAGLSLNTSTGTVTGTPSAITGMATYTVTATNTGGSTNVGLVITVNDVAPAFTYSLNPAIYVKGSAITANTVTSTGGTIVSFSVSPALPTGLSLNTTTGAVTGTPTVVAGTATYTVTATNTGGTANVGLVITVNDIAPVFTYTDASPTYTRTVAISPSNLPINTGGTPTSYSVSPSFPAGVLLNTSTGAISGTPSAVTASASYTVTATNSGGSATTTVTLTVVDVAPALSYNFTAPTYTRGSAIANNDPINTGGTIVSYSISPALSAGLSLNPSTGRISGTPTVIQGLTTYTVTGTNTGGSSTATVNITVNDIPPSSLTYSTNPATYTKGSAITANNPSASGGPIVSYSVSPPLPTGLSLNTSTGVITGTPTVVAANATYTVTATNTGGSTTVGVQITVNDIPPTTLTYSSNPATYNKNIAIASNTPSSSGGTVTGYSVSPSLPTGLSIHPTTGVITGTATAITATATYTVTATNSGGSTTVGVSITVLEEPPANLNYSNVSITYPINVAIINNIPSYTGGAVTGYSISPSLPSGLSINATTGIISGTPVVGSSSTNYTVTASNAGGSTTKVLTIAVSALPPSVSSIFPKGGSTAGGTPITITGNYFQPGATVTIGGVACTSPNVVSGTQLTCTSGANTSGMKSIVVTNVDSQAGTLTNAYLYSTMLWLGGAAQSANAWYNSGLPATGSGDGMLASTLSNYMSPDGYLYVVDNTGHRVAKFDATAGTFIGWIGAVNLSPTGGAAGCDTAGNGTATPGWCTGGSSQAGSGDAMFNNPNESTTDTNGYLYVADVNGHRIHKFNASTGAYIGWIGRLNSVTGASCAAAGTGNFTGGWCTGGTSQSGTGDGMFAGARAVRVDPATNILYAADRDNNRIQKFNATTGAFLGWIGRVATLPTSCQSGTAVVGSPTPSWCTGGTADTTSSMNGDGTMNSPRGLSIDGTSTYLYEMETNGFKVGRYELATGAFAGWIGRLNSVTGASCSAAGSGNFTGGWCTGGTSQTGNGDGFISGASRGVLADSIGNNLFIGDYTNARIERFNLTTGAFTGWIGFVGTTPTGGDAGCTTAAVGTMTPGWCTGGMSQSGTGIGQLGRAAQLSMDTGRVYLYVSDDSNGRINRYFLSTGQPNGSLGAVRNVSPTWIANGVPITGNGDGVFGNPAQMVTDGTYMWVTDTTNHRIQKFDVSTGAYLGWIGNVNAQPTGGAAGCSTTTAGNFTPGWCTGGTAQALASSGGGGMNTPTGIALYTSAGTPYLYVADTLNNRIAQYNGTTGAFVGWIGNVQTTGGTCSATGVTSGWCSGGAPTSTTGAFTTPSGRMTGPRGIAVDPGGTYLYVTDTTNGRVYRFNRSTGAFSAFIGRLNVTTGASCAAAGSGNFTGAWCTGTGSTTTQTGTAGDGSMTTPYGIAVDSSGNLLVTDTTLHRVSWYNSSGAFQGWIGRINATGGGCTAGAGLFTGSFCSGGTSQSSVGATSFDGVLNTPQGVAFDSTGGYFYVADTTNHRVSKYRFAPGLYGNFLGWQGSIVTSPTGGGAGCAGAQSGTVTPTWCTGGTSGTSNGNGAFNNPAMITTTSTAVYTGDYSNYRINRIDP
ncbi:MAG: putative Ig domain-containing protein [Bdellovibrionales bacterium]|nr:putative Ig domain-containing protein [Bdellovibrionales bacterium]